MVWEWMSAAGVGNLVFIYTNRVSYISYCTGIASLQHPQLHYILLSTHRLLMQLTTYGMNLISAFEMDDLKKALQGEWNKIGFFNAKIGFFNTSSIDAKGGPAKYRFFSSI